MNNPLTEKLEATFKGLKITAPEDGKIVVTTEKHRVEAILRFLKDADFDHLALLSAVDRIEEDCFELCFILTSYLQNNDDLAGSQRGHIILKTRLPREKPRCKTAIGIFPNAEPYEREIHELFGIKFEGHPRLTPLLLEREYGIPPFRKDFDTRQYVEEVFNKIFR